MKTDVLSNPTVRAAIEALQSGDRRAWSAQFEREAELFDDGSPRSLDKFTVEALGHEPRGILLVVMLSRPLLLAGEVRAAPLPTEEGSTGTELELGSQPPGATIFVDGHDRGLAPRVVPVEGVQF